MSAPGYPEYLDILYPPRSENPADAVRENRCIQPPTGCGQPLVGADGTTRTFWTEAEAAEYKAEWQATGLCPDCQDAADSGASL